ncbi:DUF6786 family protein [Paenibacillus eucommiae]|uniref:DUF4380 domain-containing protein n=1 Tax=Paenibacillus eucommiae TaxID=1355755 RepID=A0ABS4J4K1_9BACL|nr:DUF6786 family protein [Paenibacillus eucommiae]MBP1994031.1 hypothetical protein [Paenibacillus eucommiae]
MYNSLTNQLQKEQQHYQTLGSSEQGQMVVMERGSRVIQLKPSQRDESAFWTQLSSLEKGEWNVGGDRTWISPECNYFVDSTGEYNIPEQLDPGSYRITSSANDPTIVTEQTLKLKHYVSQDEIELKLEKTYTRIPTPFQMNLSEDYKSLLEVSYIGYECQTKLTAAAAKEKAYCNIWSIMQVPMGGTALIPKWGKTQPLVMFSDEAAVEMGSHPQYVSLPYQGNSKFKLSFDALQSTGRFGYIRQLNETESSLIVRQFQVNPSGYYPDYPATDPDYLGSCMQFFFDGNQMGGFGELEYHAPAIGNEGNLCSEDVSQLYYFIGKTTQVAEIVEHMLGIKL